MANMETFSKALMASEDVKAYVGSCKYQASNVDADITDGALVVLGGLATNAAYGSTEKDDNVFIATAPTAVTDECVIVDISNVSEGTIAGNNYKIGSKLVGLKALAGSPARFRKLMAGDMFWVSQDCFAADPSTNGYAHPTANSVKFTAAASAQSTGMNFQILDKKDFTVGQGKYDSLYLLRVL